MHGRKGMKTDAVARQHLGQVALEQIENREAKPGGMLASGILHVVEQGQGANQACSIAP